MKKILFSLLTLLLINTVFAQNEVFRVLITKGDNKYTAATGSAASPLLVGSKLLNTASVTVGTAGYVALAHVSTGKTIEVKTAGSYTVAKLVEQVNLQNASVSSKYMNYVTGQMASAGNEDLNANRQKYMSVTGSVERGDNPIIVYAESKNAVIANDVALAWTFKDNAEATKRHTFIVKVVDVYEEVIDEISTTDTSLILNLSKYKLDKDFELIVMIQTKEHAHLKSDKYMLTSVASDKKKQIETDYAKLTSELDMTSPLSKLICASYLAEQGLVLNSMAMYKEAIALQPEVAEFKTAYSDYVNAVGLAKLVNEQKKGKK
ncbi:MAG: hypothetical protein U0U66_00990 [Cytophagaceae bacterium]